MNSYQLTQTQQKSEAFLLIIILIILIIPGRAQIRSQATPDGLLAYADKIYGTSDVLVNGWKYFPEHYNAKGSPYFMNQDWQNGSVSIQGKTFENVELLYDIVNDELLLRESLSNGSLVFVMLNKDFISSFTLRDHHFVNSDALRSPSLKGGFYELVYDGSFRFLIRYDKTFVNQYTAQTPQGSFSDQRVSNFILNDGQIIRIHSKKSLLKYFNNHKREIRVYLRENNIRYKKASAGELHQLMTYCDQL